MYKEVGTTRSTYKENIKVNILMLIFHTHTYIRIHTYSTSTCGMSNPLAATSVAISRGVLPDLNSCNAAVRSLYHNEIIAY